MIDALFGSKTRVKLLHLFLNHPGQSFYVREITRVIDEQINSVRRELSNMLEVGVITSDSADKQSMLPSHHSSLKRLLTNSTVVRSVPFRHYASLLLLVCWCKALQALSMYF
jgi:DNA-binding transcriptional ArsR family regulator